MPISAKTIELLMSQALTAAAEAATRGEVPVGAVLWRDGEVIASGANEVERQHAISRHAEIVVLEAAAQKLNNWRLNDSVLCVTIEPCTMCTAAIKAARVGTVIYGASDPSMGACGSIFDLMPDNRVGFVPRVISGVRAEECATLMQQFFKKRRG